MKIYMVSLLHRATINKAIGDSRLCLLVRSLAAPPGESRWIIRYDADSKRVSVFDELCENMTDRHLYITYIALLSEEDRATAEDNM